MAYRLKDFDWSQRVILSSDRISTLQKPILLLKLDVVDEQGREKEVVVELEQEELDHVVNQLDDARKVLQKLIQS